MSLSPIKLAVLASGGGTTLQNLIDKIAAHDLDAEVKLVIASRPGIKPIDRAAAARIPCHIIDRKHYDSVAAFSRPIFKLCDDANVDLICLAGWLNLLAIPPKYHHRIMNIHPALLPSFGGKGMFGHHVHQAVLDHGCKVSGCTVHFVDQQYDTGPIIIQRTCPVLDDDTPDTLAARVFDQEKLAYPEAIRLFQEGRLNVAGRRVAITPSERDPFLALASGLPRTVEAKMPDERKKAEERYYLAKFAEASRQIALHEIPKVLTEESPDVVITRQEHRIGIEVMRLYRPDVPGETGISQLPSRGSKAREQDSLRKRVAERAAEMFDEDGSDALGIRVTFCQGVDLEKRDVEKIASVVKQNVDLNIWRSQPGTFCIVNMSSSLWHPSLDEVRCQLLPDAPKSFGLCDNGDSVPMVGSKFLKNKITEKQKHLCEYRAKCDEIWLLLVIRHLESSTFLDLSQEARDHVYSTGFDRIFVLTGYSRYVELKVTPADGTAL